MDLSYEDKHSINRTNFYIDIAKYDSKEKIINNQMNERKLRNIFMAMEICLL